MNVKELEAIEAALAFFDTVDDMVAEYSLGDYKGESTYHESVEDDANVVPVQSGLELRSKRKGPHQVSADTQDIAHAKAMLEVPGRNRSRDLQKLEILQLRKEAADLQQQIEDLRYTKGVVMENPLGPLASITISFHQSHDARLGGLRVLAKRQKRLRNEAESENQYLRDIVQSQMKNIKMLKRLFQNQISTETLPGLYRSLHPNFVPKGRISGYEVLEQLSCRLSDLFFDTDRVFQSNGLSVISSPFAKVNTQPVSYSSTQIELLKCDVLPFDYRAVAKTFVRKMASDYESEEEDKCVPPDLKKKMVARVFTLDIEELMKMQVRFTGVKYEEDKREVIVLSGQNELLEVFGVAVDGIKLQERTWCVLSEISPGVCLLQLCINVMVEAKPLLNDRREFVNRVCELVANFEQEMFASVQKDVEHELLHAGC
ncbi:hypothetical protein F444_13062 [Phytophthora nicotianae P1976]|uniref:Uncharacterized protein n=1 Tax=Phytophthora nicotianae P1976 TaxID=1317066 RepID=A0A080ZUZ2_PHYNI|nr:hypothetical protein F444_13062 [Phytophthora nicotianae P1976]